MVKKGLSPHLAYVKGGGGVLDGEKVCSRRGGRPAGGTGRGEAV